jgi:formylglycine-generating enzyme required for sulfatase activity
MAVIPSGQFTMGSDQAHERPPQTITFQRPFAISRFAIAAEIVAAWRREPQPENPDLPATMISWDEAVAFIGWLIAQTGQPLRLPTEAEWEYAAKAESQTDFWCGSAPASHFAIVERSKGPQPTDSGVANPWGLHHVHGNVWEWVEDAWRDELYGQPSDGSASRGDPTLRVIKGGSFKHPGKAARSASRRGCQHAWGLDCIGFRVAMSL